MVNSGQLSRQVFFSSRHIIAKSQHFLFVDVVVVVVVVVIVVVIVVVVIVDHAIKLLAYT